MAQHVSIDGNWVPADSIKAQPAVEKVIKKDIAAVEEIVKEEKVEAKKEEVVKKKKKW